jgi:hypothetical protein
VIMVRYVNMAHSSVLSALLFFATNSTVLSLNSQPLIHRLHTHVSTMYSA